ncbi:MAG TPA: long-chain fatty acid--CoA ligase [Bacteroidales bacterium]|nr:long-chain fatty acid--CoA ligase [Bacteroidales bacterium]HPT52138.1 long-chain fatty acid--CoA ligase [Bacteroidales bacterium]
MEVTRVFDILPHYALHFQRNDALCGKQNGVWRHYSINQYIETVNNISYGLMQLGIKKGDKIATISSGRPEWNFLDMAILQLGAIHVAIYPTISENDYKYILHHAEVKMVFVSGWDILRKIENIISEIPEIKDNVYTFRNLRGYRHLNEVIELGMANPSPQYLDEIKERISPDDIMTLIYTSGTTGNMKGVILTHRNIINNFKAIVPIVPIHSQNRVLSYLPLCHIYERMMNYAWQYLGIPIYYAESLPTIADNMREIKPTIFTTVPRLLEKFYDKIIATGRKQKGIKKRIFFWADAIATSFELENVSKLYRLKLKIARKLVLCKWKAALGGKIDVIVSGGAAIQPRLNRLFWAAEMPILEGYGLTETSPVIAVSDFFENGLMFGTVGQPLPGIEVKIAEDGEILTRGHCVTQGYYKAEDLTKEAIDSDGWFHTGDIGHFEPKGQLRITGRKKEMFKTAFGKYIVPTIIENKFNEESLIDNIMVLGENKQFAAALIVPNFNDLRSWCDRKGIAYTTNEEMINHPDVIRKFKKIVAKYNASFGDTEKIIRYELIDYEWSVATGELTPTLKLRRNFIATKFADKIIKLFS